MQGRRQGGQSLFNFGEGYGILRAVLETEGLMVRLVRPADWKAHHGLLRQSKDAGRLHAIERWPHMAESLARKKDNGRADAMLIGAYGFTRMFE